MSDRIAVVTGAGSGIGRATTIELIRNGWTVYLAGRRREPLEETLRLAGPDESASEAIPTDVTSQDAVERLFARVVERSGRVDLLFNNAGIAAPTVPLEELSYDSWREVVDVNLNGMFLCLQAAYRQMAVQDPRGGRIINNGSISAHVPRPDSAPYTSTKHAVTGLTRSASLDGRKHNIAVGQIDIGNAVTDMCTRLEPTMDVEHVARTVAHMAGLPLSANVQFVTVMATTMPYIGRG